MRRARNTIKGMGEESKSSTTIDFEDVKRDYLSEQFG